MYIVVAYRWGATNNHQYFVYCGPDKEKALKLAEDEADNRGGKYDCAVYRFNEDGTEYTMDAFFPEHREPPCHDWRVDMFESLGHRMYDFSQGTVNLPDPEREGFLKPVAVEPPEWVVSEVQKAEKFADAMEEADRKRREEKKRSC